MPIPAFDILEKKKADGAPELLPSGQPNVAVGITPLKLFTKPCWISDASASPLAAGAKETLYFPIDSQGHFDWMALMGTFSVNAVMLQIFDAQANRLLSNKPVHSTTVIGGGKRYFRLPNPYFIGVGDAQREFQIKVFNTIPGAAPTETSLQMYGRRFYHKEMPGAMALDVVKKFSSIWKEYYYSLVPEEFDNDGIPTVLAPGATRTVTFQMDDTADLEIFKMTAFSTGAFTFELSENDKSRALMSGVVHSASGWGNAEFPFIIGDSRLLRRRRQLLLKITDISGAPNYIFTTLSGNMFQYM